MNEAGQLSIFCFNLFFIWVKFWFLWFIYIQEKLFKFEEYCNLAKALVVEINKVEQKMEKQRFPKTIHGIKVWRKS